eukprot:TRINITY_DN32169_c0_g1_i2.p1 TRINITY_DN32169_c0_g1~~TRINITY_DN32169_c0_g1_i2.p1  ORF type:complete len:123 (-),score=2.06 TRINITY_DN32169_c0_g1_i2:291-659(-)
MKTNIAGTILLSFTRLLGTRREELERVLGLGNLNHLGPTVRAQLSDPSLITERDHRDFAYVEACRKREFCDWKNSVSNASKGLVNAWTRFHLLPSSRRDRLRWFAHLDVQNGHERIICEKEY